VVGHFGRLIEPGNGGEAAFEGFDDLADVDLGGVADKLVAAGGAADGADEASLAESGEELVKVLLGDVAPEGDFGGLQGPAAIVASEFDKGAEAVVATSGDAHVEFRSLPWSHSQIK
jgi:hypothetical protein